MFDLPTPKSAEVNENPRISYVGVGPQRVVPGQGSRARKA